MGTVAVNSAAASSARQSINGVAVTPHFIGGKFVGGGSSTIFENRSPVDNSLVSTVPEADADTVDSAVTAARQALRGPWGRMPVAERCRLLHLVADGILRRFDDFVAAEVADTGKPEKVARVIDVPRGAANFRAFADMVKGIPTESFHLEAPDGTRADNYAVRAPKGVVAVIVPWNLPFLLMTWKVGPALACGNAVVVKPSEETPSSATLLGEVMQDVGVPAGVYNVVHGFGPESAGAFLTQHPGVDAITFTGETRTGEAIMRAAASGVRDVSFELGGKNPALVFADSDIDAAIAGTLRSAFSNTGQNCLSTERVYVARPVYEQFVEGLAKGARALRIGPPGDPESELGPLISGVHQGKVLSYYQRAVEDGATVVTGGGMPTMPENLAGGHWIEPTIWTGLGETSAVVREEIFGPCCHIRPFDEEDEALALANDSDYGLACAIWTRDVGRAHRLSRSVEAGIIWINSWFLRDLRTPFGGSKRSGLGREGGIHSIEFFSELRNVCIPV